MEPLWKPYGTSRPPREGNGLATRLQHAQQRLHSFHQVGIRCLDHQVEVVAHQTEALNLKGGLPEALRQSRDEQHAVILVAKYRFQTVTSAHRVVDRPRILNPHLPSHAPK